MEKVELDAARALADFAQVALIESESRGREGRGGWEQRGGTRSRLSRKRVKNGPPVRTADGNLPDLQISRSSPCCLDARQHTGVAEGRQDKGGRDDMVEQSIQSQVIFQCSTMQATFCRGRAKQNLTEAEKEAKRLRRILANRESARKTIRRRQTCQHSKLQTQTLSLRISSDGIHLAIGTMMKLKRKTNPLRNMDQNVIGLLRVDFHNACLNMGILGGRFGMILLLCLHLNRNLFLIQFGKGKRYSII